MTEHGWLDHHDDDHDPGFHDDPGHVDEPVHLDDPQHYEDSHDYLDDPHQHHQDDDTPPPSHDDVPYEHTPEDPPPVDDTVFPPTLDVGPLPEPVDGFPWIDTGSLGIVEATAHTTVDPVDPHELAEYAAADLPPGVDPWAALADSDDPATAALARWWPQNQQ